jgi:hypothetical protein
VDRWADLVEAALVDLWADLTVDLGDLVVPAAVDPVAVVTDKLYGKLNSNVNVNL